MQTLRRFSGGIIALFLTLGCAWVSTAQPALNREMQLKATFVFNFAQFSEWPPERFEDTSSPIVIGILGHDPFGGFIDELVGNATIAGRAVQIRRVASIEEANACHVLFIARDKSADLEQILKQLQGNAVLTVSDMNDFTTRGGTIGLFVKDNKMKFEINMTAYKNSNVVISSRVLRLAKLCCE
jgi:hypothetical protein